MKTIKGDLVKLAQDGRFDVIVHGCNCKCTMGAGIAKSIKAAFPAAYDADKSTIKGDKMKLGTCTSVDCVTPSGTVTIVNAYIQYDYRGRGIKVDYQALRSCMQWIVGQYSDKRIGLPTIGAGLAGGDWNIIRQIVEEELGDLDVTVVEFAPDQEANAIIGKSIP